MRLQGGRQSANVETPRMWRAFLAEQMRNIPPIANASVEPPRMGGQFGILADSADRAIMQALMQGEAPQPSYVFPMPDDEGWAEPPTPHR
jgi:hypothetical protein